MNNTFRRLRWWLALAIAATAFAVPVAPAHAIACPVRLNADGTVYNPCPVTPTWSEVKIAADYKGWAYVHGRADCPANAYCFAAGEPWIKAWKWNGNSWSAAWLQRGEKVYAWPYASPWHWAYTDRTGWVAIESSRLYTKRFNPIPL